MRRRTMVLQATAAVLTLSVFGTVMYRTSAAVLTATTTNSGNIFEISNLTITHAPTATLFRLDSANSGPVAVPSSGGPSCVDVTVSTAGDAADVRLYVGSVVDTDGATDTGADATASDDLELQVTVYPAGETCATRTVGVVAKAFAPVAAWGTSYVDAATATLWNPGSGSDLSRAVEISWRVQDTVPAVKAAMQGDKVQFDLIWETQE